LYDNYDESYVSNIIAFHDSPLAKKFIQMEIEVSGDPGFFEKMRKFKMKNVDPERKKIVEKLYQDLEMESFSANLAAACVGSLLTAFNNGLPDDDKLTTEEIDVRSENFRKITAASAKKSGLISLLLTYKNAELDEIRAYDEFYSSPAGRWLENILKESLIGGYALCSENAGKAVAEYVNSEETR
jgi:hypothetical protein